MRWLGAGIGLWMFVGTAMAATPEPSVADVRADFGAEQYQSCLQKIARLLSSGKVKPGSKDRYDLLLVRGECLLRLKQPAVAAEAFESASNISKAHTDLPRTAAAKAMVVLIKASPGLKYKPKFDSRGAAFDIVATEPRKQAMLALLEDRTTELAPSFDKAIKDTSLVPVQTLLPSVWELYCVELAATGDTVRSVSIVTSMGEHARELIGSELVRLNERLEMLSDAAREPAIIGSGQATAGLIGYRGLSSPERTELRQIAEYLVKIKAVCEDGRRINRRLGGNGANWDALLADCAEACDEAQKAYDARY